MGQYEHAGGELEPLSDAGQVSVGDQRLVKRIGFLIRSGKGGLTTTVLGAENVVVDNNVVVTEAFGGLREGFHRAGVAIELGLRINNTCLHLCRSCVHYRRVLLPRQGTRFRPTPAFSR